MKINIKNKLIGDECPVFFIAEAGVNHNGSIKNAIKLVDIASQARHLKKYFNSKNFSNSINISKNSLHLPSSTYLGKEDIKFICNKVKLFFKRKY
tara:strand:+ start:244 stop:528 length:285 start_codon:yes stop_codon:yes gene_type:complete